MHQRELARTAWRDAGLYSMVDRSMGMFLNRFEKEGAWCWKELADFVRTTCPQYKATLAVPLWETEDPLLRKNLLDIIDLTQRDERLLVERMLGTSDPRRRPRELLDVIRLEDPRLLDLISRQPDLPPVLRDVVSVNRARLKTPRP